MKWSVVHRLAFFVAVAVALLVGAQSTSAFTLVAPSQQGAMPGASAYPGAIVYDSSNTRLVFSDGVTWQQLTGGSGTGGGSVGPTVTSLVTTSGYTGTGSSTTAVPMPDFTFDAGVLGANFVYACAFLAAVDAGTGSGIRFSIQSPGLTASEVRTSSLEYCSSATARAGIGGSLTAATVNFAPTASQGNVPCTYSFSRMVRNVTAVGQVQVFLYNELNGSDQATVFPGSTCTVTPF